ncbi:MAG: transposase [Gammaproteobacteria bacterium]|nr:MAG: transposase [Gammaproteobacteria bacterium]
MSSGGALGALAWIRTIDQYDPSGIMNFRRYYVPNSIVFITQVVAGREPVFADPEMVQLLREILNEAKRRYPFTTLGYVFLPEHFHLLIRPEAGVNHSQIMHSIKPNFTKAYRKQRSIPVGLRFWQPRYWDHVIRDAEDFERHLHYIHYNPVKHGLVNRPEDYAFSSYSHWQARGAYPDRWGWEPPDALHGFQLPDL